MLFHMPTDFHKNVEQFTGFIYVPQLFKQVGSKELAYQIQNCQLRLTSVLQLNIFHFT